MPVRTGLAWAALGKLSLQRFPVSMAIIHWDCCFVSVS